MGPYNSRKGCFLIEKECESKGDNAMIVKKKKFGFLVKIILVALLVAPPLLGSTSFLGFNKSSNVAHAAEKRVVVGSYTLSKAQ